MARTAQPGALPSEIQNATYTYAADAQASDAYAITLSAPISAYAIGQQFSFKANTANTGAASLNVDGKGAKTIKKLHDQDLATGDIEVGQIVTVVYDGTNFQMESQVATAYAPLVSPSFTTPSLGVATATTINGLAISLGNNNVASNSAVGGQTLTANSSSGTNNTAVGYQSLKANTDGDYNTAIGIGSLTTNTTGQFNTAVGSWALALNSIGLNNIGIGNYAGFYETGSDTFYVDSRDRTNTAGDKAGAILYGVMSNTPSAQTLKTNAAFTATYGITPRVVTTTDDATAVIDVATTDVYELSAVANATTFSTTGTPVDGQQLIIRFKDAGVAKGLTWDAIFVAIGVTLPTTTVASKWTYVGAKYNSAAAKFHVLAVTTEA